MSRLSQIISYITAPNEPTDLDMIFEYTDIYKTDELSEMRAAYQVFIGSYKTVNKPDPGQLELDF